MNKKKWITKAEIQKILKDYSVRPNEFEPIEKLENHYRSKYAKGYIIAIKPEEISGKDRIEQTGRILVQHCKPNGTVMYTDFWERNKENKIEFCFRQKGIEPPDSAWYVQDLREKLERLQKKNKDLQQQLLESNTSKAGDVDTRKLEELLDNAIKEKNLYEKEYQKLKNEIDTKKKAGRKKRGESEKSKEMLKLVQSILEKEPENKKPWENHNISRAGFFRYKKLLKMD